MRRTLGAVVAALVLALVVVLDARPARAQSAPCADCHSDDAAEERGRFPLGAYREGVHGAVECALCHRRPEGSFDAVPHTRTEPDLESCLACHGMNLREFKVEHRSGVHGKMPCGECHDAHTMRRGGEVAETDARTAAANGPCLRCHAETDLRGEAKGHAWLPARDRHARMRCVVCHAPLGSERDHEIVPGPQAARDCEACHAADAALVAKYAGEDDRRSWVTNPLLFEKAYVPGAVRNRLVDGVVLALFALTVAGALFHGLLRLAASARRRAEPFDVVTTPLYTRGLRLWHWANAALVVVLAATGLRLHFGGREKPLLTFEQAFDVHNVAGAALVLLTVVFFVRNARTGDTRQYLGPPQDGTAGLMRQARFYLVGIFRGEAHPYHASAERRFNPLQQVTYAAVMYVLLPVLVLSGVALLFPQILPERIGERPATWWLATAHYLAGAAVVAFLLGHLYLATTGDRPGDLLSAMVTGRHRRRVPKSTTDVPATEASPPPPLPGA